MTKMFYAVVPYSPAVATKVGSMLPFLGSSAPATSTGLSDSFEEHRIQLEQRMSLVAGGLGSAGIRAVPLGTEEVLELLYRSFNLGELETPIRLTNP
jgi:hypothetical protein